MTEEQPIPEPMPEPMPEPVPTPEPKPEAKDENAELKARVDFLKGKLLTLQWDLDHGQLNPGMRVRYDKMKKELDEIQAKLK